MSLKAFSRHLSRTRLGQHAYLENMRVSNHYNRSLVTGEICAVNKNRHRERELTSRTIVVCLARGALRVVFSAVAAIGAATRRAQAHSARGYISGHGGLRVRAGVCVTTAVAAFEKFKCLLL